MADPRAEQAIAYIREQVARLESQLAELRASGNLIARQAGLAEPYPTASSGKRAATPSIGELAVAKVPAPGQFAAMNTLAEAAVAYFEWRGRTLGAVSLEDLRDGLVTGSCPGVARDEAAVKRLHDLLGNDPRFGRLKNGYYALAGWVKDRTKPPNE